MSVVFSSLPASRVPRALPLRLLQRPLVLRGALLVGLVIVTALATAVAGACAHAAAEPELVLLLHAMAVIKAAIALAALALGLWRFGQPVSNAAALAYLLGVWSLGGAAVFIWYLSFIALAAGIFDIGTLGLLVLAWREGRFKPMKPGA